jgi:hypothetical protein
MSSAATAAASDPIRVPVASPSTPQTTVDTIMCSVRERGLNALREPANQERLARCDAAARAQINQRIEKLLAAGLIQGEENLWLRGR